MSTCHFHARTFLYLVFHYALQRPACSKTKQQEQNRWFGLQNLHFFQSKCLVNKTFFEPIMETIKISSPVRWSFTATFFSGVSFVDAVSLQTDIAFEYHYLLSVLLLRSFCEKEPLTAISGTDQSQLCVTWRTRLILNNRLPMVPTFLASLVFPRLSFRAPAIAISFPRLDELQEKK